MTLNYVLFNNIQTTNGNMSPSETNELENDYKYQGSISIKETKLIFPNAASTINIKGDRSGN